MSTTNGPGRSPFDFGNAPPSSSPLDDSPAGTGWAPGPSGYPPAEPVAPAPRPRRGQGLARFALVLAFLMAAGVGVTVYAVLASLKIVSTDPLGGSWGWILLAIAASGGALFAFLAAVVAVFRARPKAVAAMALTASIFLPALALVAGALIGWDAAKQHTTDDLQASGQVAAEVVTAVLDAWKIDAPPVRDLIKNLTDGT